METSGLKGRWKGETDPDKKGEREDASKNGMGFHLWGRDLWNECGKVLVPVRRGKEFINGQIRQIVRGKENVGYVMKGYEFHNITSLVRLIHQIRKCHRPKKLLCQGGQGGLGTQRDCVPGLLCCSWNRYNLGSQV